ncbi:MAG: tail fiber domain-containing protein [Ferruginibacter sp.]
MKTIYKLLYVTALLCIINGGMYAQKKSWLISGNTGTNPGINFLGTIDHQPLVIKTNNMTRMYISNDGSIGIGTVFPSAKLTVAGSDANIYGLTVGRGSSAILSNVAVGFEALRTNTTGLNNAATGYRSLWANTEGSYNTANGFGSLVANTTGNFNTALGAQGLVQNITGSDNTAVGFNSMQINRTGSYNTAMGFFSLGLISTGNYNTAVGYSSFSNGGEYFNSTALGARADITASNQVRIGDNNVTSLYCMGAYAATTTIAPNMYISSTGQILRSTAATGMGYWALTGNSGTIDGTHFIGTTDKVPLNFRVNNQKAGRIEVAENTANTFYGYRAGDSNGSRNNTATGFGALAFNVTGHENTAVGCQALNVSTASGNSAIGAFTLFNNQTGFNNTATGLGALYHNIGGYQNTTYGLNSLSANNSGNENTSMGVYSLTTNVSGSNNSVFGSYADVRTGNLNNATAIGNSAIVNASNKVRLGNNNVTIVESAVGSWTTSDGRFKKDIREEVKGLEFIKLLRPVVYNFDVDKFDAFLTSHLPDSIKTMRKQMSDKSPSKLSAIRQTGFVAQEMEEAAKKCGYNFNGVHAPESATDNYSISYEKLVVPLVKAVQELSGKNDALQLENEVLKTRLDKIEQLLRTKSVAYENISAARLEQNVPNPHTGNTLINYYVPLNSGKAVLNITDMKGALIKSFNLKDGQGQVNLQSKLAAGTYQYSLFINGQLSETKQMVLVR